MQEFFCNLYNRIPDRQNKAAKLWFSFVKRIIRVTANLMLPPYYRKTAGNPEYSLHGESRKAAEGKEVIVSLTSFPARTEKLWMVIESLFRQTVKPDRIILWLSSEQFEGEMALPRTLLAMKERGLEIRFVAGDIRSHKKYHYVFTEYPDSLTITADDDIIYNPALIENILKKHHEYPESVICAYSRIIGYAEDGTMLPYRKWKKNRGMQSDRLFFGSGGGTLFPPGSLYRDIEDIGLALELTPGADDVWLNAMARLNGTRIISVDRHFAILPVIIHNNVKLSKGNYFRSQNDMQIENVIKHYGKEIWKSGNA